MSGKNKAFGDKVKNSFTIPAENQNRVEEGPTSQSDISERHLFNQRQSPPHFIRLKKCVGLGWIQIYDDMHVRYRCLGHKKNVFILPEDIKSQNGLYERIEYKGVDLKNDSASPTIDCSTDQNRMSENTFINSELSSAAKYIPDSKPDSVSDSVNGVKTDTSQGGVPGWVEPPTVVDSKKSDLSAAKWRMMLGCLGVFSFIPKYGELRCSGVMFRIERDAKQKTSNETDSFDETDKDTTRQPVSVENHEAVDECARHTSHIEDSTLDSSEDSNIEGSIFDRKRLMSPWIGMYERFQDERKLSGMRGILVQGSTRFINQTKTILRMEKRAVKEFTRKPSLTLARTINSSFSVANKAVLIRRRAKSIFVYLFRRATSSAFFESRSRNPKDR